MPTSANNGFDPEQDPHRYEVLGDNVVVFRPDFGRGDKTKDLSPHFEADLDVIIARRIGKIVGTAESSLDEPLRREVLRRIDYFDLSECISTDCGKVEDFVYPVTWEEKNDGLWRIETRCPECELRVIRNATQEEVEIFDDQLIDSDEALRQAEKKLARENMEDDVEILINAIHDDHIMPMDF